MLRTVIRFVALATCLAALVAGCSKKVDSSSVEKQVVDSVRRQFPEARTVKATCPGDIEAKKGKRFRCTVHLDALTTKVSGDITDVKDKNFVFALQLTQAIIPIKKLNQALQQQVGNNTQVTCGTDELVLKNPGETIACGVKRGGVGQSDVTIRIKDVKGNFDLLP